MKKKKDERMNVAEITVTDGTQLIKVNLPTSKKVFQIQERLDEVWILLSDKNYERQNSKN